VDTAVLQASPGNEAHIGAFATFYESPQARTPFYLHSSPEFACKKLLAAGEERIFSLAHVFRNGERSALHHPEFTILEWYRAGESYASLIADAAQLCALAAQAAGATTFTHRGRTCDPFAAPDRLTVCEAFARFAKVDLQSTLRASGDNDRQALALMTQAIGLRVAPDDSWSDLFSKVLSEKVEPELGDRRLAILDEYPASEAALARRHPGKPEVSERFEIYACGVEIANAFGELTDPVEQRARLEAEMVEMGRIYGRQYPIDEDFLAALAQMPPASGIALGADRVVMLATGAGSVEKVIWTPLP
jgi:lysyl-tRNA synthetase class 2